MNNVKCCSRCKKDKDFSLFNKCKNGTYGIHGHCRDCQKEVKNAWRIKNLDHIREYQKSPAVKEKIKNDTHKRYHEDESYRTKILESSKLRRRTEKAKVKQRENEMKRRKNNPNYRIRHNLDSRLRGLLISVDQTKNDSIVNFIGCSIHDFIKYIESKWETNMTWENYGKGIDKWQLDHILPCCSFDLSDPEQVKKCYHFSNVRPLWSIDNLKKGAKMPDGSDARVYNNFNSQECKEPLDISPTLILF